MYFYNMIFNNLYCTIILLNYSKFWIRKFTKRQVANLYNNHPVNEIYQIDFDLEL